MRLNADGSVAGTPDGVRVFPIEEEFIVADGAGWLDGVFDTVDEAIAALTNWTDSGSVE